MTSDNVVVPNQVLMDRIVALSKRRGFVFPANEIYGGASGFYDYGPYGVALKRAIRDLWWREMVELRDDVVGLDSTLIMPAEVWVASGHLANFVDPLRQCLGQCKRRWRADQVLGPQCPACGGPLSEPRMFNLMFKTYVGPTEDSSSVAYLRPETAQGMFVDFKSVTNSTRVRVPFGIAQQGRAFRNEITPGNFLFRLREFELMELEFFVRPSDDERWFHYWREKRMDWYTTVLGINPRHLRFYDHPEWTLSHYSKMTTDIEYRFPFGWGELEGIADRTDYDLAVHQAASKVDLTYIDPETNLRYLPWVIEPAVSTERIFVTALVDAYDEDVVGGEKRVVLRLHPNLAPVQVAIVPLSRKEELVATARNIRRMLQASFRVEYDETGGSIGRRYRRQDEIGTPYCVTVDFDTMIDNRVTIRDRDSTRQERIAIADLLSRLTVLLAKPRAHYGKVRVPAYEAVELERGWAISSPSGSLARIQTRRTLAHASARESVVGPDPKQRWSTLAVHGSQEKAEVAPESDKSQGLSMTYSSGNVAKPGYREMFALGSLSSTGSSAEAEQLELPVEWK